MGERGKIALAVATAWPAVYAILYFLYGFYVLLATSGARTPGETPAGLLVSVLTVATLLLDVGLVVAYVTSAVRNLPASQRAGWIVVVLFANIPGMLAYWYLHIWRDSEERVLQQ